MYKRFIKGPKESFFLFGPRGTGKSTWLRLTYPNSIWIDLLDPEKLRYYSAWPERLRETIQTEPHKKIIVIDEVQKAPELLPLIHSIIEEKRGLQFILTGSSSRKLRRTGANLLAGRALLRFMYPFYASELGADFSLKKALQIGTLPIVWDASTPEETLKTYAALYLKEEIQAEGLVRQVGDFARFLEISSFSHGNLLNSTNISRECDVARKTVENYLGILEDLLLSFTLPVFTKRAKRELSAHPKFYLFDPGVFRSLRPKGPLDKPEEIDGAALEGLVASHLHAWCKSQNEPHSLSFWRTRSGSEVDFIIYGPTCFLAIEVKLTKKLHPSDTIALEAFQKDYPEATPLILYMGETKILSNNIAALSCEDFLKNLHPDLPINFNAGLQREKFL